MKSKGRAMKSVRVGRDPRRCEPAGRLCGLGLACRHERVAVGHDQCRLADPGKHQGGNAAVRQPGGAVREGEPLDQGQVRRVSMDRPDVRGEAGRGHAADRLHRAVHRRSHARRQRTARRPHERGEGTAVLLQVQPRGHRGGHRLEEAGRRSPDRGLRAGAPLQPQALRSSRARTRTSRRRPGPRSRPTRS